MTFSEAVDHAHAIGATILDIINTRGGGRVEVRHTDGRYESLTFAWARFTPRTEEPVR